MMDNKALTNADRIRAMSDEELAMWVIHLQSMDISAKWCDSQDCADRIDALGDDFICTDEMNMVCATKWMGQPAKGELRI